jgi:hypothetical protein
MEALMYDYPHFQPIFIKNGKNNSKDFTATAVSRNSAAAYTEHPCRAGGGTSNQHHDARMGTLQARLEDDNRSSAI